MISDKAIVWIIYVIFIVLIIVAVYGSMEEKHHITFTSLGLIIAGILFVWFILPLVI